MAPLLPSNTARFKFHYSVGAYQHTVQVRTPVSPAVIGGLMGNIWTAFATAIFSTTIDSVEFAASGSNIFNAVTTGIEGNVYGTGAIVPLEAPYEVNFVGRSALGRRCRMMFFGIKSLAANYRYSPTESILVDAALAVLVSGASNILAIDGSPVVWKSYVNAGTNSHWQKAVR